MTSKCPFNVVASHAVLYLHIDHIQSKLYMVLKKHRMENVKLHMLSFCQAKAFHIFKMQFEGCFIIILFPSLFLTIKYTYSYI